MIGEVLDKDEIGAVLCFHKNIVTEETAPESVVSWSNVMDEGIGSWIRARALRGADDIALVDGASGSRKTYRELDARVDTLAAALHASGVRPADRVALLATNSSTFFEIMFAVARVGAILVPVNFRLSPSEIAYVFSDSGAKLLFVSSQFATLAEQAVEVSGRTIRRTVIVDGSAQALDGFAASGDACRFSGARVSLDDTCMIMYTSGTTGWPKGAMLTHGNMLWNAINMCGCPEGLLRTDATLAVSGVSTDGTKSA